jgi:predicted metal-binding protein
MNRTVVWICTTCKGAADSAERSLPDRCAGSDLADAAVRAAAEFPDVSVQKVRCLANCGRGPSAAIRCEDSWTYVFGYLAPDADGPALLAGARLLAQSADGIMPWKGRPESLKRGLIARVPPAHFKDETSE